MLVKMNKILCFCLILSFFVKKVDLVRAVNNDLSIEYYHLPTETKNPTEFYDTSIEDAEDELEVVDENLNKNEKKNIGNEKTNLDFKPSTNTKNSSNTNDFSLQLITSNSNNFTTTKPNYNANVTRFNNSTKINGDQYLNYGLQLNKGLTNITKKTGQHVELKCIFKCIKNIAGDKCDIKYSNVKWYKNEAPIKNQKNKIEINFIRKKNLKDIITKLNIHKLDTHDKGFYKCELRYNKQSIDSVGVLQVDDQEDRYQSSIKLETNLRNNFVGLDDDSSSLNPSHYEPSLNNLELFQKTEKKFLASGSNSMDYLSTHNDKEQCILYRDEICSQYLPNQTIIVQSFEKHQALVKRLHNLISLISEYKTLSFQCLKYAMSAICHYTYPLCDKQKDLIIKKRLMCRQDCEFLEHSICKTEYELAKLQNLMQGDSILPNCNKLPKAGSKESEDCVHLDLPNSLSYNLLEDESCYNENGKFYRGKASKTINGIKCEAWDNQHLISIADYPELYGGHNFCRNPDGKHQGPFCIINDGKSWKKELCDIKECGDYLTFLIFSPALIACLLFSIIICSCCMIRWYHKNRKSKKKKKCSIVPAINNTIRSTNSSYTTVQAAQQRLLASLNNSNSNIFSNNLQLSNDLNLLSLSKYGIAYLPPNSNIELNSLLTNSNDYQTDSNVYQMKNHSSNNIMQNIFQNKNLSNNKIPLKQTLISLKHYSIDKIEFLEDLGQGAFGMVFKGNLLIENDYNYETNTSENLNPTIIPIAIKTLKEDANSKFKNDFKHEAELMADLKHPNIVCLLGVCFDSHPMCMLFEFMSEGDLHKYLQNHSPMTNVYMPISSSTNYCYPNNTSNSNNSISSYSNSILNSVQILDSNALLHIATQIAAGMEYLASHHYVHRDLAARNCLVSDHLTVKIADFGLSRDIYSQDYYRIQTKSLLPVRWMPAESILYGRFSSESDVWSFGVLLWELFTYAKQPYYGHNNQEVIEMIRNRTLLDCPENCPINVYNLMLECWNEHPFKRPNFSEIHSRLRNLKAVYSNNCTTNFNNTSTYETPNQSLSNNNLTCSNFKSKEEKNFIKNDSKVVNSNSCGNLLEHNLSIKKEKFLRKFLDQKQLKKENNSEQYQKPLSMNQIKNFNVNSTGNLNFSKSVSNNLASLTKNLSFNKNYKKKIVDCKD